MTTEESITKFSKTLETSRGTIKLVGTYTDDYLTINIGKHQISEFNPSWKKEDMIHTEIFNGKVSLKTELDESGLVILPDWIEVQSARYKDIQPDLDQIDAEWTTPS
tara:strand:- start:823 stop:1143 length:321 start_codon:yes stop_codon:yes gene_type:complete